MYGLRGPRAGTVSKLKFSSFAVLTRRHRQADHDSGPSRALMNEEFPTTLLTCPLAFKHNVYGNYPPKLSNCELVMTPKMY